MKIQMICVGKIKETYLRELIDHYTKIIRKKYNFEIIELPDEKTPDNASDKEESKIKEIEGQRILDKIPEGSFVIPLSCAFSRIFLKIVPLMSLVKFMNIS